MDPVAAEARLAEIDQLVRRDPARRGLIASKESRGPLCPADLAGAARDLAAGARRVVIVTGFYIPAATPAAAETDGPPGAALLGAALASLGVDVQFVTDPPCSHAVEVAVEAMGLPPSSVIVPGTTIDEIGEWFERSVNDPTQPPWTHLITIERVGPSHTRDSIMAQIHRAGPTATGDLAEFERLVPDAQRDRCYNMRGICLDEHTAPLHRLFELAGERRSPKTIGIGDGGNEIGMGNIRWLELRDRLNDPAVARIPCRIRTDWTIVAGVSNWGAMGLTAATLLLRDRAANAKDWTAEQHRALLQRLVSEGPAVDGITRLPEPTVDGLPFLTYIQPWEGIRRVARMDG